MFIFTDVQIIIINLAVILVLVSVSTSSWFHDDVIHLWQSL